MSSRLSKLLICNRVQNQIKAITVCRDIRVTFPALANSCKIIYGFWLVHSDIRKMWFICQFVGRNYDQQGTPLTEWDRLFKYSGWPEGYLVTVNASILWARYTQRRHNTVGLTTYIYIFIIHGGNTFPREFLIYSFVSIIQFAFFQVWQIYCIKIYYYWKILPSFALLPKAITKLLSLIFLLAFLSLLNKSLQEIIFWMNFDKGPLRSGQNVA